VDGSASNDAGDMLAEARMAMLLQRVSQGATAMSAREVLEIATLGGAQVLGRADDCGRIAPGWCADIAVWDMSGIETSGNWDPVAALVLCGPPHVRDLLVGGRLVVGGGALATADTVRLAAEQRRLARRLLD
jgi:cytosine/adenosine deaminase-related metal-dependent hydrolase